MEDFSREDIERLRSAMNAPATSPLERLANVTLAFIDIVTANALTELGRKGK